MSDMRGGSIPELQNLEQLFRRHGEAVTAMQRDLDAAVNGATWQGPRADRFRNEWNSTFKLALSKLKTALDQNGLDVNRSWNDIEAATR